MLGSGQMPPPTDEALDALVHALSQHAVGGINPDESQLRTLVATGGDGPLHFVNLLAYYEVARYPDGHELAGRGTSGAVAYARYGEVALRHVTQRGGRLVLYNDVVQTAIGAGDDAWDHVAIMEYPTVAAFFDMITDPDYVAALVHRDAGLARTRLLVSRPLLPTTAI